MNALPALLCTPPPPPLTPEAGRLVQKLITFALNVAVARAVSPSVLGIFAVQFDVAFNSLLAVARDPLRQLARRAATPPSTAPTLCLPAAALAAPLVFLLFDRLLPSDAPPRAAAGLALASGAF
jgi:hypothetical protein